MRLEVFDTSRLAPADQFDFFYARVCSAIIRIRPAPGPAREAFPARLVSFSDPRARCHLIEAPAHAARRGPPEIRDHDPAEIHLSLMLAGEREVVTGEGVFRVRAGEFFALDTRTPFAFAAGAGRYRALKLALPARLRRDIRLPARPDAWRQHPLYGLFVTACRQLAAALEAGRENEIGCLTGVAEMIWHAIAAGQPLSASSDRECTIYRAVLIEIERSLGDPEFDLARLSASLGVGRRSLQRLLARHGTSFSELLRERRLTAARARLSAGGATVEQVAAESGYLELSAFYRAFRRRFGVPPGELRRVCRPLTREGQGRSPGTDILSG